MYNVHTVLCASSQVFTFIQYMNVNFSRVTFAMLVSFKVFVHARADFEECPTAAAAGRHWFRRRDSVQCLRVRCA